jgi:quercetin dioxygenase-like cupin family protein
VDTDAEKLLARVAGPVSWDDLPEAEPHPGVHARRFDTEHATVVRYELAPGAEYPLHRHPEEQLVQVLVGNLDFQLGDSTLRLAEGDLVHVAGDVRHGARCRGPDTTVFLNVVIPRRT